MEIEKLTIEEAHALLRNKELSARDLVSKVFASIRAKEEQIHAYIELFEEEALVKADETDMRIQAGDMQGVLDGMPIAVKDNILIKDHGASAGSRMLEPYKAAYNATAIRKLTEEGSIYVGRTNMDEFAMGSSTESSAFGPTKNPHDTARVPGGSSGGSAAAVAAGGCIAALGSDTGGSIRQPAAFCGVVGLKPTYGSISRSGLIAMASSLDQIGPITRSVADAEILFRAMSGKDPLDSTTIETAISQGESSLKEYTIGIPKEYFVDGLDEEVRSRVQAVIDMYKNMGVSVKEISLPNTSYALSTYYILMPAEVSANLARLDGIRYGFSKEGENLFETYARTREEGFGPEVRRRIILGTYVLSAGYYDAYYAKAQKVRALIKKDFDMAFKEVDAIISPTTPTPAFKIGEKTSDPLEMYLSDIYTVPANLAGIPAISIPCGYTKEKLPVGFQLMARMGGEDMLFALGKVYESRA